jgi:hypothetical protein
MFDIFGQQRESKTAVRIFPFVFKRHRPNSHEIQLFFVIFFIFLIRFRREEFCLLFNFMDFLYNRSLNATAAR